MTNESSANIARAAVRSQPLGAGTIPYNLRIGGGEMGRLVRSYNWAATPAGPIDCWPAHLCSAASIVLNSAFPMFIWWGAELTVIYNDAYRKILGDLHPGALGKSARQLRSDIWPHIGPLVVQVLSTCKPVYRKDLQLYIQHGRHFEERYFTFSYSPIRGESGKAEGLFCAVTETTDEVLDKQKLLSMNQAKDEFISLASHQLRTPATGAKQYLGMLLGGFAGELNSAQSEFVQHAYDSNERQLNTINDLLSIAQADAGRIDLHRRPVDLVQLIEAILEEQSAKFIDRRQTVNFKHTETACSATIDMERMRMVLENLVDNASKYTHPGKRIQLNLTRLPGIPDNAIITGRTDGAGHGGKVLITIRDQGVGISKKDIETIFDKFIRAENPLSDIVGGNGLGLYLARKIVELHDGRLNVSSTIGKGSTFTITLPLS